jgi:hypothetical protein
LIGRQHIADLLVSKVLSPFMPSDNSGGERAIRPAVQIRKNIFANGSEMGVPTQAIFATLLHRRAPHDQPCGALRRRMGAMGIGTQFKSWHGIRVFSFVLY